MTANRALRPKNASTHATTDSAVRARSAAQKTATATTAMPAQMMSAILASSAKSVRTTTNVRAGIVTPAPMSNRPSAPMATAQRAGTSSTVLAITRASLAHALRTAAALRQARLVRPANQQAALGSW